MTNENETAVEIEVPGNGTLRLPAEFIDQVFTVPPPTSRVLTHAAHTVTESLAQVRAELHAKRAERDALNDEIRQLVADEELLRRMARLAEQVNGDGHEAQP